MGTAVIIVLFQLYQACAVTRRGENGFSEKDKVNTTTVFKKKRLWQGDTACQRKEIIS